MSLQISAGRAEVIERRFRGRERQLHQPAGSVVDERQQRAPLATILEPGVFRAVDLHQFAQAFTPPPRLVRRGFAVTAVDPQGRPRSSIVSASRRRGTGRDTVYLCPTIARNPGITWRASIGYGALRLFGVPFRRPPVLWPLAMASIHPSILQKRRRRRVEAMISQALRECSRYLILPIGYPDDRVACSLHSHRPAAAYLHRRAASNCVYLSTFGLLLGLEHCHGRGPGVFL